MWSSSVWVLAGSMAAKTCAKFGLDTVLVEKEEYPSKPFCLSCVTSARIVEYLRMTEEIGIPIYRLCQGAPDGTEIFAPPHEGYELGFALNRKTFDGEVLKLALRDGAEFMNRTRATGLIREDGKIEGIKAVKTDTEEEIEIRSKIVIGADGVESHVGRWAKIYETGLDVDNTYVVLNYMVDNVADMDEVDYHTYDQFFGYRKAQDVIFSMMPKGDGKMAISAQMFHSCRPTKKGQLNEALDYLIKNHPFLTKSNSNILERAGGVCPVNPLKVFVADGAMLVGDAAHQQDLSCISKGVLHVMDAGTLAGEVAIEAHKEGDFSLNLLSRYEKRWWKSYGERDTFYYHLLRFWQQSPNEYFNRAFHILKDSDNLFTDEFFDEMFKSRGSMSELFDEVKKDGLDIHNKQSFLSYFNHLT
ncbi:MAG: Digeranylgeranylglycerophospholipid reductase [Candidatus Methanolliviera sp. GoM_asphalt]|nr:MAG: Digeranylgeranylglycerophospholipid reductase [Candidatus Methanolliviera sp. GoM_asphalt]